MLPTINCSRSSQLTELSKLLSSHIFITRYFKFKVQRKGPSWCNDCQWLVTYLSKMHFSTNHHDSAWFSHHNRMLLVPQNTPKAVRKSITQTSTKRSKENSLPDKTGATLGQVLQRRIPLPTQCFPGDNKMGRKQLKSPFKNTDFKFSTYHEKYEVNVCAISVVCKIMLLLNIHLIIETFSVSL